MAKKPRSKSPARRRTASGGGSPRAPTVYTGSSKRVLDYLAKHPHATVAQARGHKPAEHATRKERARAVGRLDENQRASVRRFAHRQAKRTGAEPGDLAAAMLDRFNQPGGARVFERIKAAVARHAGMTRRQHKIIKHDRAGTVVSIQRTAEPVWDSMGDDADDWDVPDDWLWYH